MQPISDPLLAILKSRFQAASSGFRARVVLAQPASPPVLIQSKIAEPGAGVTFDTPPAAGNLLVLVRGNTGGSGDPGPGQAAPAGSGETDWTHIVRAELTYSISDRILDLFTRTAEAGDSGFIEDVSAGHCTWFAYEFAFAELDTYAAVSHANESGFNAPSPDHHQTAGGSVAPSPGQAVKVYGFAGVRIGPGEDLVHTSTPDADWTQEWFQADTSWNYPTMIVLEQDVDFAAGSYTPGSTMTLTGSANGVGYCGITFALRGRTGVDDINAGLNPKRVSIDKSLRLLADQAEVEFENEGLPVGWGPSSVFETNQRIHIWQWYGDLANAILTFTGLVDKVSDHRDVLTTTISCRDMFAILVDQTFSASAPQGASEDGAVRTEDNGVYLNREVSYIVSDLLERAGWPVDDRDVTATSYVLDEFIMQDGASYADTIVGDTQLTGLVGYSAWADELGVFHFAPTLISTNLTDPPTPDYTYRSGEDIISLDDVTDQYDLRTRVKVRGPLTTTTLQDTWRELWRTTKLHLPVGIWYDPSDSANIRVVDRGTKRLYKIRQSDRAVLSSVYLGGVIPHPLGLSGDPADAAHYWVLNAPWIDGISGGNSIKKVRKSDNVVIASFSLPSGRWSAIKASTSNLWLTNLDTDRFYKRSKVDGSAIANYSHTYASVVQANPSGLMVDGTTLYLFWSNGGTTARFLKCDVSAPGTVTGVVKTAGTVLHGGEMDTTTHTECYGDSDSLGLVAKFTLLAAVDQTNQVSTEVVDTDLEDELGVLALLESRQHDTHPTDPDHPFEVRRMTLDLTVITNIAQADETARRQLAIASQRRRVLDVGMVGNPALQKTDYLAVVDVPTDMSTGFVLDTYRTEMTADGTYLGIMSLLPVEDVLDTPSDGGDATVGGS